MPLDIFGNRELARAIERAAAGIAAEIRVAAIKQSQDVAALRSDVHALTSAIYAADVQLANIEAAIYRLNSPPSPAPGNFRFRFKSEVTQGEFSVASNLYDVDLPELQDVPEAKDVVRGEILLNYDGVDQPSISTSVGQAVHADLKIKQGTTVNAAFRWIDDAGNPSKNPLTLQAFVVADDIAPPDPVGGFGFRSKGEVEDDPAPTPEPAPTE